MGSRFFIELRDNKKIFGTRCPLCNRVYMPPRSVCGKCFSKLDESQFVELSDKGMVLSYTVVNYKEPVQPKGIEPSIVYGIIQLDVADTGFVHFVAGAEPEQLMIGMRVQAVFKEKREANILDTKYFKPLGGEVCQ